MSKQSFIKSDRYYGVYVGVVINITDPEDWGRAKVRVNEIYGSSLETPDESIPWAYEISKFGGSYDSGCRTPYLIGSTVAVVFEEGDPIHPMILGGVTKRPSQLWDYQGNYSSGSPLFKPPVDTTELPKEARRNTSRFIAWKTPKGAAIIVEESDGGEFFRILDRSGQIIELSSPAQILGTGNPRGDKNKIDSDGLTYAQVVPPSTIKVVDLAGQKILLHAEPAKERVEIVSQARAGVPQQKVVMDTSSGQEFILIQDAKGQYYKLSAFENKIYMSCLGDNIETVVGNRQESIGMSHTKTVGMSLNYNVGLNTTILSGGQTTITSTLAMTIQALLTMAISVASAFTMSVAAAATITVTGVLSLLCTQVVIGVMGSEQKLCNLAFLTLFNSHTHTYNPGPGGPTPTSVPVSPGIEDTHTTKNVKCS